MSLLLAACVTLRGLHDEIVYAFHQVMVADMVADVLRLLSFVALSLVLF